MVKKVRQQRIKDTIKKKVFQVDAISNLEERNFLFNQDAGGKKVPAA